MKKQAIIIFFLLFVCAANVLSQNKIKYNVYLRSDAATDTMWDGRVIRIYGMASRLSESPHIPAKVLYCNEGDTVVLNALSISQGDFHTIHLHGLDVNTRNDGDPATSFSLSHNQDTTYTFYAAHAGTYLYHCHVADVVHVQMGMYGLVVVKAAGGASTAWTNGPHFDRSYNWILSEIDPAWHDNIPPHDHAADTVHIPPYVPKYFLINGKSETQLPNDDSTIVLGSAGETIYLRIGAIGFFTNRVIFPKWMKARKIDSDGRPLPESIDNDTVEVAPGERYGVLLTADRIAQDNIAVEFVNMNTDSVWSTQHIPVIIQDASVVEKQSLDPSLIVYPNPATDIAKI
jgi:FtsP/CotA-like multicopper oxidase with cupredoxin domain